MAAAIATEWEKMPWLVQLGVNGDLVYYVDKKQDAPLCRRDVVNNAELLGPLLLHLGNLHLNI